MHEDQGVGGGVGGDPEQEVLRQLGQGELEGDAGEEDAVKDGEAFQQVGKAGLQLDILLGQRPHADDVTWETKMIRSPHPGYFLLDDFPFK